MPKREALEPLFIHIPSVRPLISESLSKWFVHAVEASGRRKRRCSRAPPLFAGAGP